MKLSVLPVIALSCFSFAHLSAQAAPEMSSSQHSQDKVMVVERSGKPPFKRSFAEISTVDVAQFEISNECEDVKIVSFRGKPPFKRSTECVNVVDVAQFEIDNAKSKADFSGKPPFKRF